MKPFNKNKLRLLMAKLPQKIGKIALAHVMRNFSLQGFQNKVVEKWKKPANPTGRKTLIDTGRLKAGFKMVTMGNLIKIYNLVPYAGFHNKGTSKLPQRKMVGESAALKQEVAKVIKKDIIKALKR